MKKTFIVILFFSMSTALMAVPAKPGVWKMLPLADGSEIRAELCGDEFASFWTAENGKYYVEETESKIYREVELSEVMELAQAKRAEEAEMSQERMSIAKPNNAKKKIPGGSDNSFKGEKKGLIILVNFADLKFETTHDKEYYTRFANEVNFTDDAGNTHSVRDYFLDQSYGMFDLSFDIAGPIELENDHAYYGYSNSSNSKYMVQDACDGAYNEGIDFSKYDWDGDGVVEQVFIIYAGHGAADTGNYEYIWPHKSSISYRFYKGIAVSVYACGCELAATGAGDGIGTVCHEFSHCMGLPDAYDSANSGFYGMGTWSILATGCYNGDSYGYLPAGYTAYERACCGWLTPIELTEETDVEGMKGLTENGEAYIVYNQGNANELYMLENRTANGFDSELAGDGLLITHIDYSSSFWLLNVVNANYMGNNHERYTIIPADNVKNKNNESTDTWPNADNTRLDNHTSPADDTYRANIDGEYYMNISLSDIQKADDGTISFNFYPEGTTPSSDLGPEGAIFYESFNKCKGSGGNDGDFGSSYIGSGEFIPDNSDWVCNTARGGLQCAFFGSNTQAANLTTPTFSISGETTFSFRAAPFTAIVPAVVTISCVTEGITLSETEISLPQGEWTDFSISLYGEGDVRLRMTETTGINRFFLDEVVVMPADVPEGINPVSADDMTRQGIYSTSGQQIDTPVKGVNIIRYNDGSVKKLYVK